MFSRIFPPGSFNLGRQCFKNLFHSSKILEQNRLDRLSLESYFRPANKADCLSSLGPLRCSGLWENSWPWPQVCTNLKGSVDKRSSLFQKKESFIMLIPKCYKNEAFRGLFVLCFYNNTHKIYLWIIISIFHIFISSNNVTAHFINRTAHVRHQCTKTIVLSCHRCLINSCVENMNYI